MDKEQQIKATAKNLIAEGFDGMDAYMMALWMVNEGITKDEASERITTITFD